jgi:hypothetical protein
MDCCNPSTSNHSSTSVEQYVADLASQNKARDMAHTYGLDIVSIAWEDMGRNKNSCYGPCINDMTLCVGKINQPIIRRPNFTDLTCDVPIDKFQCPVGNENDNPIHLISLKEYLSNLDRYTGNGKTKGIICDRDTHILTSTQACILPLRDGKVEFDVRLFNYRYDKEDPQVLTVVVSDMGTSAQVIAESNQRLLFNKNGQAAHFQAQRLTDYRQATGSTTTGSMTDDERSKNKLMVFQIPLKQTKRRIRGGPEGLVLECVPMAMACCASSSTKSARGLEDAIIGVGRTDGPFKGTCDLALVRDERYPIRCTVQYYSVTDTIDLTGTMFKDFADKLNKVYNWADAKGSLVVEDKTNRVTEATLQKPGSGWAQEF